MRHLRPIATVLMAAGLVLAGAGCVAAKGGDAIATLDEPLPPGPAAGSTVTIGWSLDLRQDDGTTLPFYAENVFVRFTPPTGKPIEVPGYQDRQGHFTAEVRCPRAGWARSRSGCAVRRARRVARASRAPSSSASPTRPPLKPRRQPPRPGPRPAVPRRPASGERLRSPRRPWHRADPAANPATSTPPAPAPQTAPSVDGAWLAALMVIGLALTGILVAARGRGRTSAA